MQCHEVDYKLIGDDMQIIEVELDKGETVIAKAGAMNYMDDGISFETKMGDGSNTNESVLGKLFGAGFFGGEGMFLTTLSGTGTLLLQSLPFFRLADRILRNAPSAGGTKKGEGSILGALGGLLNGDNR